MCSNVIFHNLDYRSASNQRELAAIIGQEHIVMDAGGVTPSGAVYEDAEFCPDDCLCPVNLPATAIEARYEHSSKDAAGEHDPFDYHWRKLS